MNLKFKFLSEIYFKGYQTLTANIFGYAPFCTIFVKI
jgi:hypothetical protein